MGHPGLARATADWKLGPGYAKTNTVAPHGQLAYSTAAKDRIGHVRWFPLDHGDEKVGIVRVASNGSTSGIVGIGYEGQTLATFVAGLQAAGITSLVDVRLTPLSRKPGFSKRALHSALAREGITYQHRPELGNPRENRDGFGQSGAAFDEARANYAERLNDEAASAAIVHLARAGDAERVAVLCFEADESRCHRQVILAAVQAHRANAAGNKRRGH